MFKELESPKYGANGWFITVKDVAGWLTVNGIIETRITSLEDYYFDSELDAHNAALNYYYKHNLSYPYYNALYDLRRAHMDNEDDTKDKDISESQVMEFE